MTFVIFVFLLSRSIMSSRFIRVGTNAIIAFFPKTRSRHDIVVSLPSSLCLSVSPLPSLSSFPVSVDGRVDVTSQRWSTKLQWSWEHALLHHFLPLTLALGDQPAKVRQHGTCLEMGDISARLPGIVAWDIFPYTFAQTCWKHWNR